MWRSEGEEDAPLPVVSRLVESVGYMVVHPVVTGVVPKPGHCSIGRRAGDPARRHHVDHSHHEDHTPECATEARGLFCDDRAVTLRMYVNITVVQT